MAKPVKCHNCGRRFADEMARFTHTKHMHPGAPNERPVVAQPVGDGYQRRSVPLAKECSRPR